MLEIVILSLVIVILIAQLYNKHKKNNYTNYKSFIKNNIVLILATIVSIGCLIYEMNEANVFKTLSKKLNDNFMKSNVDSDVDPRIEPYLIHNFYNNLRKENAESFLSRFGSPYIDPRDMYQDV
jgi:high-affinity Fe2+/Pb2+ permease